MTDRKENTVRRRFACAVLTAAVGALALAVPANADFHAWKDATYMGTHWTWSGPLDQLFYVGGDENDEITSYKNVRSHSVYFTKNYPLHVWDVNILCEPSGAQTTSLNNYRWQDGSNVNDTISGLQLTSGNPC
jgi:hypothetical protein